jgi:AmmeMemoRadiSam system protein B/AmmeMemoRadiSam system protein A
MAEQFIQKHRIKCQLGLGIIFLIIFAIIFFRAPGAPASVKPEKMVLRSELAGKGWYQADTKALRSQIENFYKKAEVEPIEDVIGLILPHAGYVYSGETAIFALKASDKSYKRIVIVGPSHHVGMEEMLSVPRVTHYETPLGQIPLDVEFINKLLKFPMFQNVPHAHKYEHSVQIELPLLQYHQKDFKLVPVVAGRCLPDTISKVGDILKGLIDQETLVIASSDFTHYGPNYGYVPFSENIPEKLKELDMGAYEYITRLDSDGFLKYRQRTGVTICGYVPIAILISMLDKSAKVELMKYATSGELTGDFTNSVSYLSIAFSGRWDNYTEVKQKASASGLSDEDKKQLLALARKTIVYALKNRKVPEISELDITFSDAMKQPRAAFVTLKKNEQLRGCIGDIFPQRPLYQSIIINAINASFRDRRFSPLSDTEVNDITIEISALTAPEPVDSSDEIRIGIDGVVLNKGSHSAVYLPQVAPEQGWDLEQTLIHLSLKAGLPADAWKEGASFLVFQADVFGEEE